MMGDNRASAKCVASFRLAKTPTFPTVPVMMILRTLCLFLGLTVFAGETEDLWAKAIFLQVDPALNKGVDANARDGRHFEAALRSTQTPHEGHTQARRRASERARAPIYVTYGDFCFGDDQERNTRALRYYIAAATRDPDCIEAWYRIALNALSADSLRDDALKSCMRLQPGNALHFYTIAIQLWEKGDRQGALDCIQQGNAFRVSMMKPLVPDAFEYDVPMAAYFCYLGIEGKPVTREFLASLSTGFKAADLQFVRKVRAMVADLSAAGEPEYLEACGQLGLGLILNAQRDVIFSSVGFGLVRTVAPGLKAHYAGTEQGEKAAGLKTILDTAPVYMARLQPALLGYEELPTLESRLQNMDMVLVHGRTTTATAEACLRENGVTTISRLD
jgi:hypothetical protein